MSRPFSLATVARVRRIRTGLARIEVARSQRAVRQAEAHHADAIASLAGRPPMAALGEFDNLLTADGFVSAAHAQLRLAHDIEVAQDQLERAVELSRAALDGWQVARTSERVTDLLEAAHHEAVQAEELALEQRVADDRAGSRWFVARQEAAS